MYIISKYRLPPASGMVPAAVTGPTADAGPWRWPQPAEAAAAHHDVMFSMPAAVQAETGAPMYESVAKWVQSGNEDSLHEFQSRMKFLVHDYAERMRAALLVESEVSNVTNDCCSGHNAVAFLVGTGFCCEKEQAILIGRLMVAERLLYHQPSMTAGTPSLDFDDSSEYYRFSSQRTLTSAQWANYLEKVSRQRAKHDRDLQGGHRRQNSALAAAAKDLDPELGQGSRSEDQGPERAALLLDANAASMIDDSGVFLVDMLFRKILANYMDDTKTSLQRQDSDATHPDRANCASVSHMVDMTFERETGDKNNPMSREAFERFVRDDQGIALGEDHMDVSAPRTHTFTAFH